MTRTTYSGLSLGTHEFQVLATDAAGNREEAPAVYTWTIVDAGDTVPPETVIETAPLSLSQSTSATFTFSATEAGSTFECSIDLKAFTACTSPKSYNGLAGGDHFFYVRARDGSGNGDPSPAVYEWTVEDVTPPDTRIEVGPADPSSTGTARFEVAGSDNTLVLEGEVQRLEFECRLDSNSEGGWSECG